MKQFLIAGALALGLVACARDVYVEAPSDQVEAVVSRVIHGDTRFSSEERFFIQAAAEAWGIVTRGRARLTIVWDLDDASVDIIAAEQPVIIRSSRNKRYPDCGGNADGDVMRIVPAVCTDIYACSLHEMGHYLGLNHVPYGHAVMAEKNPSRQFATADRVECARVGLCDRPRARDITTVTVTVDPHIPNVEPEYPNWPTTP